jgi:hypothetical protein
MIISINVRLITIVKSRIPVTNRRPFISGHAPDKVNWGFLSTVLWHFINFCAKM